MLRKLIIILIITAVYCSSAISQIETGIRAGLNLNLPRPFKFSQPGYNYELAIQNTLRPGFHFGLVSRFKMFGILIQPEILFTSVNNDLEYEDITSGEIHLVKQEFNRLDMPVLALLRVKAFKLELGPVGSILLKDKSVLFDEIGYEQKYNIASLGYQAGLGFDISKFTFDIKYEGNLSKFGHGIEIGEDTFNYNPRSNQFIASMGVFF